MPGGAAPFLQGPVDEFTGTHVPLEQVWGRAAGELRERLHQTPDAAGRLRILQAALLARSGPAPRRDRAVDLALARLEHAPVAAVVRELDTTAPRFIRMFSAAVGLPPKRYARIRRLQRAVTALGRRPLATIAVDCGFFDQAHLHHEFRDLAGVTPGEYLARREARNQLDGDNFRQSTASTGGSDSAP